MVEGREGETEGGAMRGRRSRRGGRSKDKVVVRKKAEDASIGRFMCVSLLQPLSQHKRNLDDIATKRNRALLFEFCYHHRIFGLLLVLKICDQESTYLYI